MTTGDTLRDNHVRMIVNHGIPTELPVFIRSWVGCGLEFRLNQVQPGVFFCFDWHCTIL